MKIAILYHFFYPDDVVSARHFTHFAEELVKRGWEVTVFTSNRYCRYPRRKIQTSREKWRSINILRLWRPAWNQANKYMRLLNSIWMMIGWSFKLMRFSRFNAIVIGSDPQFSQFLFPIIKLITRNSLIVYWCYDLYPEAIIADNPGTLYVCIAQSIKKIMKVFYRNVELIVDIGPCMRNRLKFYKSKGHFYTLTPWALVEPSTIPTPNPKNRKKLFDDAKLALLYSGNIGKAHDFRLLIRLAEAVYMEDKSIAFCFACRGNRYQELKNALKVSRANIRLAPFVKESELEEHLASADIHLLSLRKGWQGIVVPSKFFGSIAMGRPVLYAGPENSDIASWIKEYGIGFLLKEDNVEEIKDRLLSLSRHSEELLTYQKRAYNAYKTFFSKNIIMEKWDKILRKHTSSLNQNEKILQ